MSAEKKYIRRFFVPKYENNSKNALTKVFVSVREYPKRRKLWFSLARRRYTNKIEFLRPLKII